jgi:hypothetical protein
VPTTEIIDRNLVDQPSAVIGIVLGQVLYRSLNSPEYVLIVVEDVLRRWQDRKQDQAEALQLLDQVDPLPPGAEPPTSDELRELHEFVDDYTHTVEGRMDLPDAVSARLWMAHVLKLAPADHPVHTNPAVVRRGEDPGI